MIGGLCSLFLPLPFSMDSPEDLYNSGIFINDLSMHDSSRDFILAGSQQNPELNLALNQVRASV
jgi:guanylate cyclase